MTDEKMGDEKVGDTPKPAQPAEPKVDKDSFEYVAARFAEKIGNLKSEMITPEEFEKDEDTNYHIDAIYSMANCRAEAYKLEFMDWMTVKIKAGRIIPALATTTASVAGL